MAFNKAPNIEYQNMISPNVSPIQGNVSIIYWRLYSQTYLYRAQTKIIYIEPCHDKAAVTTTNIYNQVWNLMSLVIWILGKQSLFLCKLYWQARVYSPNLALNLQESNVYSQNRAFHFCTVVYCYQWTITNHLRYILSFILDINVSTLKFYFD